MNKRKEIMIALALILAAGAAVVGSRMIKNNKHSEVNTETENASEKVVQESELVADRDSEEVPQETQEKVQNLTENPIQKLRKLLMLMISIFPRSRTTSSLRCRGNLTRKTARFRARICATYMCGIWDLTGKRRTASAL